MSGREPILNDPLRDADGMARKIVALSPDDRPQALQEAEEIYFKAAKLADRTDGEAGFFAYRMREIVEDAIARIGWSGAGRKSRPPRKTN